MNCNDAQEFLSAYVDRALNADEQTAMREHCDGCAACQKDVQSLLALKVSLRGQSMPKLPRDVIAKIEAETIFKKSRWSSWRAWGLPTLTLAAAVGAWLFMHAHDKAVNHAPMVMPIAQQIPAPQQETLLAMHRSTPSIDDLQ